ncbi:MAG: tetratricopeptide repeat protein [Candidatus Omnitrophota bacterium]
MNKIILIVFFSLMLCQNLCRADNSALLNKEKKLSEERKLLQEENVRLRTKNKDLEEKLEALKNINSRLEQKAKEFYIKVKDCGENNRELDNLNSLLDKLIKERKFLKNENGQLSNDIARLKDTVKKEEAQLYEELGTAYTQAKLYDDAIEAYEKSLSFDRRNADVYYYLGLLYKHSKNNDKKAISNLKQYLKYKPGAKNRDEIKYLIDMLKDEF